MAVKIRKAFDIMPDSLNESGRIRKSSHHCHGHGLIGKILHVNGHSGIMSTLRSFQPDA